jgi:putative Mn2+ efflux pump MntP
VLKLILFVLPLGLDTFAVAAALGIQGLPAKERLKASLLMSSFEMAERRGVSGEYLVSVLGRVVQRNAAVLGKADSTPRRLFAKPSY